ncbi:unnamed protein product [Allacma fusca]|uniref:CD63 antigen n=1 Tax=Allacma fusca TaxID=39272 RepID=A0A8J2JQ58_9HEXA|nr:unnamed protein product [Allacma fusca]
MSTSTKYRKDEGWCSKSLLRNYLYIFNFFFLCGGIIVLAVGVWSIIAEHGFVSLLSNVSYPLTSYLLVSAGVLVLIASVIGCCGIKKSNRCFLLIYILMLLLVFLLEAKAGILAYIYREQAYQDLKSYLNETFIESYGTDASKTDAIDSLQREHQCCGVVSFEDWNASQWKREGIAGRNEVPDSCCKTESPECGIRNHPSNIYYSGCLRKLSTTIKDHLGYLTIAGLGLCILQIIGIIFSTCLYIKLKNPDITDL